MSTTATRMASHAPSPSYVPRNLSRPASPALPPTPSIGGRSVSANRVSGNPGGLERRGSSSLRHEIDVLGDEGDEQDKGTALDKGKRPEVKISPSAQAVLNMISALPAPLSEKLPPRFLPTPSPSPPKRTGSFTDHFPSPLTPKKRPLASNDDKDTQSAVGLGLGLSVSTDDSEGRKKRKSSPARSADSTTLLSPELKRNGTSSLRVEGRGTSPGMASPSLGHKKELGQSGLRNEIGGEGLGALTKDQWRELAQTTRNRALLLKRHGDAYSRSPSAQPAFAHLPADRIKGLLCLTDAVLLWLWSYFCDEQAGGRVRTSPYSESAPLREFVRRCWESEMRKAKDDIERDRAKAMVGLMHLIEAVVCYHLTAEQLSHLSKRSKELSSQSHPHNPSPPSTTSASPPDAPPPTSNPLTNPSPPTNSSPDSSTNSTSLPPDILPLISSSTSTSSRASQHLLTSRHHLPLSLIRHLFPKTYTRAINSDLSDVALPAPGDGLGSAKWLDVDVLEKFVWPIELGMWCPVGHLAVFGRGLVDEFARASGREWEVKLES